MFVLYLINCASVQRENSQYSMQMTSSHLLTTSREAGSWESVLASAFLGGLRILYVIHYLYLVSGVRSVPDSNNQPLTTHHTFRKSCHHYQDTPPTQSHENNIKSFFFLFFLSSSSSSSSFSSFSS